MGGRGPCGGRRGGCAPESAASTLGSERANASASGRGVPFRRFLPLTAAGCAIWSAAFVLAGSIAGEGWHRLATTAGHVSLAVSGLILGAVLWAGKRSPRRGTRA